MLLLEMSDIWLNLLTQVSVKEGEMALLLASWSEGLVLLASRHWPVELLHLCCELADALVALDQGTGALRGDEVVHVEALVRHQAHLLELRELLLKLVLQASVALVLTSEFFDLLFKRRCFLIRLIQLVRLLLELESQAADLLRCLLELVVLV